MFEELKQYIYKPNTKNLKELKDRCAEFNINFDQMLNKAKEEVMKEKAKNKLENPANLDSKLQKRVNNGNKLIENLQSANTLTPYADSILMSARYNKMRILEAHVSNYSDDHGTRASKINETDKGTGRNALHYLSYMCNTDMI